MAIGESGATNKGGSTIKLTFFDASGSMLGSDSFLYDHTATADGVLDWHGWQFAGTGIRSLTYEGFSVVSDGLQATTTQVAAIPEPEIYAMLTVGLGLVGWAGRRRKATQRAAA